MSTIFLTRPHPLTGEDITHVYREGGVMVRHLPVLKVCSLAQDDGSERTISELVRGAFSWLVCTSPNGVAALHQALNGVPLPSHIKVAVQGTKTGEWLQRLFHCTPQILPSSFVSEAFVESFRGVGLKDATMLLAVAKETRGVLAEGLRAQGAIVTKLPVYETIPQMLSKTTREEVVHASNSAFVLFFSPSAVHSFWSNFNEYPEFLRSICAISIGPITTQALLFHGCKPSREARNHTEEGVVAELKNLGIIR